MPIHDEGRIRFDFPPAWQVCRPEKTAYHKRHFQTFAGGCKEMDFVLFEPASRTLWLLEVKDYRTDPRIKPLELSAEVAQKSRDALALLLGGAASDDEGNQGVGAFIRGAGLPVAIRVALHLELPRQRSKLFPGVKNAADQQMLLRRKVRCLDRHALVCSTTTGSVPWVSQWQGTAA